MEYITDTSDVESYVTDTSVNYVVPHNVIVEPVPAPELLNFIMDALKANKVGSIKIIKTSGSQLYQDNRWYTSPYTDELSIYMHVATVKLVFTQGLGVMAHCDFTNTKHKINGCVVKAMYTTPIDSSFYDNLQQIFYKIEEVFGSSLGMDIWDALGNWQQSMMEEDKEGCDGAA